MTGGRFARISRAEALEHGGQIHEARAALCSLAQDTSEIWWARLESVNALVRLGLKDDAVHISHAMLAELPVEGKQDTQIEIAEILARLGEGPALILAILRHKTVGRGRNLASAFKTLGMLGYLDELLSLARDLDVGLNIRFGATSALIRFGRSEEAEDILQGWANPTAEVKNTPWFKALSSDAGLRCEAARQLSQFPGQRKLAEQVWDEVARGDAGENARIAAVDGLWRHGRADVLLKIGADQSIPPKLQKRVVAWLAHLGYKSEAEAILRDRESR